MCEVVEKSINCEKNPCKIKFFFIELKQQNKTNNIDHKRKSSKKNVKGGNLLLSRDSIQNRISTQNYSMRCDLVM